MPIKLISKLREMSGIGIIDCKNALKEANNDIDKAYQLLRKKGMALAVKKINRSVRHGLVYSYIHGNGILGVLVEVNCETDFVAKTEDFKVLVKEIAMQIAATAPTYISREFVPLSIIETEKEIYESQLKEEKKSEKIWDKIINGRLEKFYNQVCLYDQIYIRDMTFKRKIKDLVMDVIAKVDENIVVKRFIRFRVGEE
ncbi:MAG: elongation factor Ts [Endomicrobium sp.]|jgi:elongation factor Ts|nr:elongation factor Ts [Endomicrobium sp.]